MLLQTEAHQLMQWRWLLRAPSLAGVTRLRSLHRPFRGPSSCTIAQTVCRPPLQVQHQLPFSVRGLAAVYRLDGKRTHQQQQSMACAEFFFLNPQSKDSFAWACSFLQHLMNCSRKEQR